MLTEKNVAVAIHIRRHAGVNFCTFKVSFRFIDILLSSSYYLEAALPGGSYRSTIFRRGPKHFWLAARTVLFMSTNQIDPGAWLLLWPNVTKQPAHYWSGEDQL